MFVACAPNMAALRLKYRETNTRRQNPTGFKGGEPGLYQAGWSTEWDVIVVKG